MHKSRFAVATILAAGMVSLINADDAKTPPEASHGTQAAPRRVVVEESVWYPLRLIPESMLHNAQLHYRQHEEKAAANELRKAESWLNLASSHAMAVTKDTLRDAAMDLGALANDIEQGTLNDARRLDNAIAKSEHALAEWHFFKAKESLGKSEENWAAQHLETASQYLRSAAESAHYEYGDGTVKLYEEIDKDGRSIAQGISITPDRLSSNLNAVQREVAKLGAILKGTVK